ncbi:MAG: hypothetical protein AAF533_13585 [Acidobacteriota bacterium]
MRRFRSILVGVAVISALWLGDPSSSLAQEDDCEPIPQPPGNFLEKPFRGDRRFLFYRVRYSGRPVIPLTGPTGTLPPEGFQSLIEDMFEKNSQGRLSLTAELTEPLTMPQPQCYYDTGTTSSVVRHLHDLREVAMNNGWDYSDYDQEVVLTERFWQLSPQLPRSAFNLNFRVTYITNASPVDNVADMTYHEVGHGLKFEHASFWAGGTSLPPAGGALAYGDEYDPMGDPTNLTGNQLPFFNPRHARWAGWLSDARVPVVQTSGLHTIEKIESQGTTGLKAIRVRKDAHHTYWIFYRGDDLVAQSECQGSACNGAVVTRSQESNLRPEGDTLLVHVNPAVPPALKQWRNALLHQGQEFYDPDAQATIRVEAVRPDDIDVRVTFDESANPTGIDNPPIIDILSPAPGEILSGAVEVAITAYDPDVGTANFDGIQRVELEIMQEGSAAPQTTLYRPGCTWTLPTDAIDDGAHDLQVRAYTAEAQTAPAQVIRFRFLVCNENCPPAPQGPCGGG